MAKNSDRLLGFLLAWVTFTAVFPTIILYRAALQPNYQWGMFGVTGVGLSGGYLVVLVAAVWAWAIIVVRRRGTQPPFAALLISWNAFLFASIIYGVLTFGSDVSFRGDTLGIEVRLAIVGPVAFGAFLLTSVLWWWRNRTPSHSSTPSAWSRRTKILMGIALALVPAIAVLFVLGDGVNHTNYDLAAIVLVAAQCILVGAALDVQDQVAGPPTDPSSDVNGNPRPTV